MIAPYAKHKVRTEASVRQGGSMTMRPDAGMAEAVMLALFGVPQRKQRGPFPWSKSTGGRMDPIVGSVLQFVDAPPGWSAVFATEDEDATLWEEPIVGWGVLVIWTSDSDEETPETTTAKRQYQTEVQPLTVNQEGAAEFPLLRENAVLQALLQPGQVRIAQQQ